MNAGIITCGELVSVIKAVIRFAGYPLTFQEYNSAIGPGHLSFYIITGRVMPLGDEEVGEGIYLSRGSMCSIVS